MPDPDLPTEDLPRPKDRYVPPHEADAEDRARWREVGWLVIVGLLLLIWAWGRP